MDRGAAGIRWSVTGALHGSTELWLEPVGDGVVVHYYLRADDGAADPVGARAGRRRDARAARPAAGPARVAWKRCANALKDELEGGRAARQPRGADPAALRRRVHPDGGSFKPRPVLPRTGG